MIMAPDPVTRRIEAMNQSPILSGLPPQAQSDVAARMRSMRFGRREIVGCYGRDCRGTCIITDGSIALCLSGPTGRELEIGRFHVGEHAGGAVGLAGAGETRLHAYAVEPTQIACLPAPELEKVLEAHPEIAHSLLAYLCRWERRLVDLLAASSLLTVRGRLARLLLDMAAIPAPSGATVPSIRLDETKVALARRLGCAREVLSRELRKLARSGAIDIDRRRIMIRDRKRLAQLAGLAQEA